MHSGDEGAGVDGVPGHLYVGLSALSILVSAYLGLPAPASKLAGDPVRLGLYGTRRWRLGFRWSDHSSIPPVPAMKPPVRMGHPASGSEDEDGHGAVGEDLLSQRPSGPWTSRLFCSPPLAPYIEENGDRGKRQGAEHDARNSEQYDAAENR